MGTANWVICCTVEKGIVEEDDVLHQPFSGALGCIVESNRIRTLTLLIESRRKGKLCIKLRG